MELPSKYAPNGLSKEDQKRVITVRSYARRDHMDVSDNGHYNDTLGYSQDVEMMAVDDLEEAQMISDIVASSRIGHHFEASDEMELDRYILQTTQVSLKGNISYLIIDTNFIISQLRILDELKNIAGAYGLVIVIPIQVIRELDGLKKSSNQTSNEMPSGHQDISTLARAANDWIFTRLAERCPSVKGQRLKEKFDKFATKDDAILDCCLYYKAEFKHTLQVLFSNDKNLCLKALTNDILTVSFQRDMSPQLIAAKIYEENAARYGFVEPEAMANVEVEVANSKYTGNPGEICTGVYSEVQAVVAHVVNEYMEAEFGEDLALLQDYRKDSLVTLSGAVRVIIRFWRSVFSRTLRDHEPFEERGSTQVPTMISVLQSLLELLNFVDFWTKLLFRLYEGNSRLQGLEFVREQTRRWSELARSIV